MEPTKPTSRRPAIESFFRCNGTLYKKLDFGNTSRIIELGSFKTENGYLFLREGHLFWTDTTTLRSTNLGTPEYLEPVKTPRKRAREDDNDDVVQCLRMATRRRIVAELREVVAGGVVDLERFKVAAERIAEAKRLCDACLKMLEDLDEHRRVEGKAV
ncbi:hypothetical protein BJ508DRAFT_314737 [Ascobolus immersus RN42]|uniref:Uncharacterized protein n=1 Tax=Ascobolus immersus RN42 TaxID=1160509 RepID=A0A3N4HJX8_ASCIM|nr:hypothetical protein BJ508DRAFT_314737 [Ascobolus immersus RN42]